MKKTVAVLLTAVIAITFFACGKKEGNLGKQTTVDKKNGYTLVEEVLTFKYNDDEEEIKKNPNAKTEGFVTNESNAVGKVNTKSAVLDIAKKEVGEKFNKVNFAFDRTQGIWRVTFSMDTVTDETAVKVPPFFKKEYSKWHLKEDMSCGLLTYFQRLWRQAKKKTYISGRLVTDYFLQSATSIPQF